ncbi:hypothetical protein AB0J80_22260 [Actinoplanes sp. NPDC049548]|uniref:hypothetical protein n=1 Tax=Actinoplanes sp. NPDC049548 TaxID=3155152 RepID=UPI00341A5C36
MPWITSRSPGRRVTARDAAWSSVEFFRVLGPFPDVPVDAVRRSLIALHAQRPTSRFVCRLDHRRGRWVPLSATGFAQWVDRLIVPMGAGLDADACARVLNAEVLEDRPMVLAAGGRFGGLRASHSVGDARVTDALLAEVLAAATTGRTATYPVPRPDRLPWVRAFAHQFGGHPGRLPAAVRIRRPPPPATSAASGAGRHLTVAYASAASAPGTLTQVRKWRDEHAPGVAVSAVLFSAMYATMRRNLGEPDPAGFVVLVDARRYLPAGLTVEGNFVWGEHVRPTSPEDPAAVAAAVAELVRSRRVLTMLGLHNLRSALHRVGAPMLRTPGRSRAVTPATPARPHLTVTYLGRNDSFAALPWSLHDQARIIGVVSPSGPRGITVAMDELDDALHITASYHPEVFDSRTVTAAVVDAAQAVAGGRG